MLATSFDRLPRACFCDQFDSPLHAGSLRHPTTLHALADGGNISLAIGLNDPERAK